MKLSLSLLLLGLVCAAQTAAPTAWLPAGFQPPVALKTAKYQLVPLGPDIVKQDYAAYMGSIEHLQKTMGGNWPNKNITMADAMKDMEQEQARYEKRRSFAYGVLSPDRAEEYGSVYIRPSRKQGYDATVSMWTTQKKFDEGFEKQLMQDMKQWVKAQWPFQKVAYLGDEISKEEFAKLPNRQ